MDQNYKDNYYMSDGAKEIWKMEYKKITDKLRSIPKDKADLSKIRIVIKEDK